MVTCRYCGNGDVPEYDTIHAACGAEFDRRKAEGLCIYCGEKLAESDAAEGSLGHEKCYHSYNFSGYPGQ